MDMKVQRTHRHHISWDSTIRVTLRYCVTSEEIRLDDGAISIDLKWMGHLYSHTGAFEDYTRFRDYVHTNSDFFAKNIHWPFVTYLYLTKDAGYFVLCI